MPVTITKQLQAIPHADSATWKLRITDASGVSVLAEIDVSNAALDTFLTAVQAERSGNPNAETVRVNLKGS